MSTGMMKKDKGRFGLRKYCGKHKTFTALITKKGEIKGKIKRGESKNKHVCLEDIKLVSNSKNNRNNDLLCDHVWVYAGQWSKHLETKPPMLIQFNAKVDSYIKYNGENKRILSWKIDEIEDVRVLKLTVAQYKQLIRVGRRNIVAESYTLV